MEIVYVLANACMPGIVKIGRTAQDDANTRIGQLYTTGVPIPFDLRFACRVENGAEVERALHHAFAPYRVNPKREFFSIDAEQAIAILKLLHTEEATALVEAQPTPVDSESVAAAEKIRQKRPPMNFHEMGIPNGSELHSLEGGQVAVVVAPKKVLFNGEEMSLTAATRQLLRIEHSVQPSPHWTFEGKLLREIYDLAYEP